ncbi:MAG TPA: hypothetical protein VH186_15620 [Chloroflexia bacterium]|nr:hypothetical protein [Chloroflexia bacterium]
MVTELNSGAGMVSLTHFTAQLAQTYNLNPTQLELVLRRAFARAYAEELALPETSVQAKFESLPFAQEMGPALDTLLASAANRRLVKSIRRLIIQGLQELQASALYSRLIPLEGQLVIATVQRVTASGVFMQLDLQPEAFTYGKPVKLPRVWLPGSERLAGENVEVGRRLPVILTRLNCWKKASTTDKSNLSLLPVSRWRWVATRTSPELVEKLFALELPWVEIKGIAREPGVLTKIAIGAGPFPQAEELATVRQHLPSGERLCLVKWSANPAAYIASALAPGKISSRQVKVLSPASIPAPAPAPAISTDLPSLELAPKRIAEVQVAPGQLGHVFGRQHVNLRLAEALTGWQIELVER